MKIPQKKSNNISFLFGEITDDETYEMVEKFAINQSISFEKAKLEYFHFLMVEFSVPKDSYENYYESLYKFCTKKIVYLPKFCFETYSEKGKFYPKIIVTNNYVIDKNTKQKFLFTNPEVLQYYGSRLGEDIGFEYLKYEQK